MPIYSTILASQILMLSIFLPLLLFSTHAWGMRIIGAREVEVEYNLSQYPGFADLPRCSQIMLNETVLCSTNACLCSPANADRIAEDLRGWARALCHPDEQDLQSALQFLQGYCANLPSGSVAVQTSLSTGRTSTTPTRLSTPTSTSTSVDGPLITFLPPKKSGWLDTSQIVGIVFGVLGSLMVTIVWRYSAAR
jgi:hypothetical protein